MLSEARSHFIDRRDAGQRLAAEVKSRSFADPVVLALPRGGVPVGFEVAHAIDAPLDVLLVRKLGAPGHAEFGIGAIVDGAQPQFVLNTETVEMLRITPDYIDQERARQLLEIERRRRLYRGELQAVNIEDCTVIIVDDGIATGGTVLVALRALHKASPRRTVLAVPVAPPDAVSKLSVEADEIICLSTPWPFGSVGRHYNDFTQTSDEEVIRLLAAQRTAHNATAKQARA